MTTRKNRQLRLAENKRKLAEKYTRWATKAQSKPKQATFMRKASDYNQQAEQIAREASQ